jgi:hypothetical protein
MDSATAPTSALAKVVQRFELRFEGLTVTDMKRTGQYGHPVIKPSEDKVSNLFDHRLV